MFDLSVSRRGRGLVGRQDFLIQTQSGVLFDEMNEPHEDDCSSASRQEVEMKPHSITFIGFFSFFSLIVTSDVRLGFTPEHVALMDTFEKST